MVNYTKRKKLYEGSSKILFESPEPGVLIQHFKDDVSAINRSKKGIIPGKGVINNRISEYIMVKISNLNIPTHFIKTLNMREQLIKKADMIPIKVVVRNVAAGKITTSLALEEGRVLPKPIVEYYLKSEQLNDPMLNEDHIISFGWANQYELEDIKIVSLRVNDFLSGLFLGIGIRLIDFKLEFGRITIDEIEYIVLADEISPDTCRLWDINTNEKLDRDRFRNDMDNIKEAYMKIAKRLGLLISEEDLNKDEEVIDG